MSKTLGQVICEARKRKGLTIDDVGPMIGKSRSIVSIIERDLLKGGPDPETVVRLAECLGDNTILITYLECNPVYRSILPKIFPELNHIRTDAAIILGRLRKEMAEAMDAIEILEEMFSNADPRASAQFVEIFKAKMEQIIDVKRGIEILEFQLLAAQIMDEELRREIYQAQDEKCIRKGHHIPEGVVA